MGNSNFTEYRDDFECNHPILGNEGHDFIDYFDIIESSDFDKIKKIFKRKKSLQEVLCSLRNVFNYRESLGETKRTMRVYRYPHKQDLVEWIIHKMYKFKIADYKKISDEDAEYLYRQLVYYSKQNARYSDDYSKEVARKTEKLMNILEKELKERDYKRLKFDCEHASNEEISTFLRDIFYSNILIQDLTDGELECLQELLKDEKNRIYNFMKEPTGRETRRRYFVDLTNKEELHNYKIINKLINAELKRRR